MRILVTGAAGFLGRALVERLYSQQPHDLHVAGFRPAPVGAFHPCDLRDAAAVAALLENVRPDQVYHLAGRFSNDFDVDYAINVNSTRHLLESVRQANGSVRVLLIGSAAEYGLVAVNDNPVREDRPLAPVSIYGWTKACQTLLMNYYHAVYSMDVVMARMFNLAGQGASNQLFVGRVDEQIERLLKSELREITVGNLEASRDYLPVNEAARQLERVMRFGQRGMVYHVASGKPKRIRDLLGEMLQARGVSWGSVRESPRPLTDRLDVPLIYADISRTNNLPEVP